MALSDSAQAVLNSLIEHRAKDAFSVPEVLQSIMDQARAADDLPVDVPENIPSNIRIGRVATDAGTTVFQFTPHEGALSNLVIIYYHGGGFVMEIDDPHWRSCCTLASELDCCVLAPIYPLAPLHGFEDAYAACYDAFLYAQRLSPESPIVLMGDSAGGHLAIAMAQMALMRSDEQPDLIVAISPWVDIADEVPGKAELDEDDPMLALQGMESVAGIWAPATTESRTFPPCCLHGPFEGLASLLIFTGTREILHPEALAFAEQARSCDVDVELVVGEGLWHCWAGMLEMDEGREAFDHIVSRCAALA